MSTKNRRVQASKGGGNAARVVATQGRRASNAAGKHDDRRLKRLKTRSARNGAALREF